MRTDRLTTYVNGGNPIGSLTPSWRRITVVEISPSAPVERRGVLLISFEGGKYDIE